MGSASRLHGFGRDVLGRMDSATVRPCYNGFGRDGFSIDGFGRDGLCLYGLDHD